MKTLKFIAVALLLASSFVVYSEPIPSVNSTFEAKQELLQSIRANMYKWNAMSWIESGYSTELVVYCTVNEQNQVEVIKIDGARDVLKQKVISLMEKHPVEASSDLIGNNFAFKLRFETKEY